MTLKPTKVKALKCYSTDTVSLEAITLAAFDLDPAVRPRFRCLFKADVGRAQRRFNRLVHRKCGGVILGDILEFHKGVAPNHTDETDEDGKHKHSPQLPTVEVPDTDLTTGGFPCTTVFLYRTCTNLYLYCTVLVLVLYLYLYLVLVLVPCAVPLNRYTVTSCPLPFSKSNFLDTLCNWLLAIGFWLLAINN